MMYGNERLRRAHGKDKTGTQIRDRLDRISETGAPVTREKAGRGAEPMPDPRIGGKVAHESALGAPRIYAEKPQGRRGTKGIRR